MNPGVEAAEQIEMGRRDEQRDHGEQRHQPRPQAFPGERHPRQADLALDAGRGDRGGFGGVHRVLSLTL